MVPRPTPDKMAGLTLAMPAPMGTPAANVAPVNTKVRTRTRSSMVRRQDASEAGAAADGPHASAAPSARGR